MKKILIFSIIILCSYKTYGQEAYAGMISFGANLQSTETICLYKNVGNTVTINNYSSGMYSENATIIWQQSYDGINWNNITGLVTYQNGLACTVPDTISINTYYRRGIVDPSNSSIIYYSNILTLIIHNYQTIIGNDSICEGSIPTKIKDGGDTWESSPWDVMWYKSTDGVNFTCFLKANVDTVGVTNISNYFNYQPPALSTTTYYYRIMNDEICNETYQSNTVTINVTPTIVNGTIANNQTICSGSTPNQITSVNLPSGGAGSSSFTYQWEQSVDQINWTNITGENNTTYSPNELSATTYFRRQEISENCSTVSNIVTITVVPSNLVAGNITSGHQLIYCNQTPSQITAQSSSGGSGTYSYLWFQSEDGINWNSTNATTVNYTPGVLSSTQYFQRQTTIGNGTGTVCSTALTLTDTITVKPFQPALIASAQTIECNQAPVELAQSQNPYPFNYPVGYNTPYTYQWQQATDSVNWTPIAGATNSYYSPAVLYTSTQYRMVQSMANCPSEPSNMVKIKVTSNLTPGTIGYNETLPFGSDIDELYSLTLPTGATGFSYQWQYFVNGQWTNCVTEDGIPTNDTYLLGLGYGLYQSTPFRREEIATGSSCGIDFSNTITMNILPNLQGGVIGNNQTICDNSQPSILANIIYPTGLSGTYTYQWQQSPDSVTWTNIANATNYNYAPGVCSTNEYFRRICYDKVYTEANGAYSNVVKITVTSPIVHGTIENNPNICYNGVPQQIENIILPSGGFGNFTYQWQQSIDSINWTNIPTATSVNYQSGNLTQTTWFKRVETSGSCSSVNSNILKVKVFAPLSGGSIGSNQNICFDAVPNKLMSIALPSGGSGNFTYQWQQSPDGTSWTDFVMNADSANFQPSLMQSTTYFQRTAISSCGVVNSNLITITVMPNMVPGQIGTSQTLCFGTQPSGLTSVSLPTGGTGSYTYQWQQSKDNYTWTNITGATSTQYLPAILDTTTYYVRQETSGVCGTDLSNKITITVLGKLIAGAIGNNQTTCYNSIPSMLFETKSANGGNGSFTYQWQLSYDGVNWSNIQGANSSTYQPGNITVNTWFRRIDDSGSCTGVTTNSIEITVSGTLTAGQIGSNQSICYNTEPALITSVSMPSGGSGTFTYQWQLSPDGSSWTNILLNGNSTTYQPGILTSSTYFRRVETCSCGSTYSNIVVVAVLNNLVSGEIGTSQTLCYNTQPSGLTLVSNPTGGTNSYTYQWQQSANNFTWTNIAGATSTQYMPTALTSTTYYQLMQTSGSCGSIASNAITITVYSVFKAGIIGSSQTVCNNSVPSAITEFAAATGGSGSYTYQWQLSYDGANWSNITNANSNSYQPGNITENTWFRRIDDSGSCTGVTTNSIEIIVSGTLTAGQVGSNQSICYNTEPALITSISLPIGGSGTFTYQWQQSPDGSSWTNILLNGNSTTYQPADLTSSTYFRRMETCSCGSTYSNTIVIAVMNNFVSGQIGTNQTLCYNSQPNGLSLISNPTGGTNSYTYQWQQSTNDFNWTNIAGATSTQYLPAALTSTTYYQLVQTSGGCGSIPSNAITITVYNELIAGTIGSSQNICYNSVPDMITESVVPTGGSGVYTYQWQQSFDGVNWANIINANSDSYQPGNITENTWFRRIDNSGNCTGVPTNSIKITVSAILTAGIIGNNQSICYNTNPSQIINLSLPSGGSGTFTYQWQQSPDGDNWTNIVLNGNTENYQPESLTTTTYFRRMEISSSCGSTYSNTIIIEVYSKLTAGKIESSQYLCYNSTAALIVQEDVTEGGTGSYTYQWQQSYDSTTWVNIENANTVNYLPGINNEKTYYRRQDASGICGTVYTDTVRIQYYPIISAGLIGVNQQLSFNVQPSNLTGENPSGGNGVYSYQWQESSDSVIWTDIITNSNSENYQPPVLTQTTFYRRIVGFNTCGSDTSNVIKITILNNLTAGIISSNQTICYNTVPELLTGTNGSGGSGYYTYNWQTSTDNMNWQDVGYNGQYLNYQPSALTTSCYFRRELTDEQAGSVYSNVLAISVYSIVTPPKTNISNYYCKHSNIKINITDSVLRTYQWTYNNVNSTGNSFISINTVSNFIVSVVAIVNNCYSNPTILNVNIDPITAEFTASQTTCNIGDAINFTNYSINGNTYIWNFYDGDGSLDTNPYHYYYIAGQKNVKLTATSLNGCSDSLIKVNYITVNALTSVNTASEISFMVYPNPVNSILHVNMGNGDNETDVIFMNISGQILQEVKGFEDIQINCEGYPSGFYLLKVKSQNIEKTVKIIKID